MNPMRISSLPPWLLPLFAAWPLGLCFAEEDSQPLTVEPAVSKVVESLAAAAASRPLRRAVYRTELAPSGATTSASTTYEPVSKNVWGVTTVQRIKTGWIQTRTVSLCGLIDLVGASTSVMQFENSVPVPVGSVFIPMGMRVTKAFSSHTRTATLGVPDESNNLCAPQPGGTVSYSLRTETELTQAPAGSPKILSNSFEWRCTVGAPTSSGALETIWPGSHIPVTCNSTNAATGKSVVASYAYVVEAGFYLRLGTVSDTFQARTKYSSIESSLR
jgi:hypothetical protein